MSRQTLFLAAVLAFALFIAADATAYQYDGVRWDGTSEIYYLHTSVSAWSSPIRAAGDVWTKAGSKFSFVYKGTTEARVSWDEDDIDHKNIVMKGVLWGPEYAGILALNHTWYNTTTKRIIDSDIIFNTLSCHYLWVTDGSDDGYDVQDVVTHEMGHSLQLGDLYSAKDAEKTMYGYAEWGETKKRTLHADDIAGIKAIYGSK
ncbi:MAG: matrixin family metalloprotease [Acidobacteriota bacterium]